MSERSSPVTEQNIEAEAVKLCERLMSLSDIEETAASELEALDTDESNEEAMGLRQRIDLYREAEACITLLLDARALQPATHSADPIAERLVDWVYLHATEGQQWPSSKTKSMLIARAIEGEPTQDNADGMKAAAPAADAVAGDAKALAIKLLDFIDAEGPEAKAWQPISETAAALSAALRSGAAGGEKTRDQAWEVYRTKRFGVHHAYPIDAYVDFCAGYDAAGGGSK